jgi:glyoxylase-like metal-dependent hydrolase (beta-lactamase superfamily II)
MLMGRGGNMAVSTGPDGAILIDDQYAPLTEKIVAAVRAISDQPIGFVINTHWHGDHTGGNENLGKAGAVIVAHGNVRKRMSLDQIQTLRDRTILASPEAALPVITFTDSVTFHLNGQTTHILHLPPAHTDGDSIVHFAEADVVHTGDILFNGFYPYIDVDSGGSIDGMIAAHEKILELAGPDTVIIPGHGPRCGPAELQEAHDMLLTVRDRVRSALTAGMKIEALVATGPLADLNEKWGGGFMKPEVFLRIVYADLSR